MSEGEARIAGCVTCGKKPISIEVYDMCNYAVLDRYKHRDWIISNLTFKLGITATNEWGILGGYNEVVLN